MKLTIHLIPIPPPNTSDQHPAPHTVFHYTTGLKLQQIINSGAIQPTTAGIEPQEKPVAWYSTSPHWEPTASKVPIPGMPGQLITANAQHGLARITVPAACAPHGFEELPRVAGTSIPVCQGERPPQPVLTALIASRVDTFQPAFKEVTHGSTGRSAEVRGMAATAAAVHGVRHLGVQVL